MHSHYFSKFWDKYLNLWTAKHSLNYALFQVAILVLSETIFEK